MARHFDIVYGEDDISDPVVIELMNLPDFLRLKKIDLAGYAPLYAKQPKAGHDPFDYSRFAHSLGVFLLLKKFGAPVEEQVAGLLHDVSHSAFSHCIDYVLAGGSPTVHDLQDNIFENFLKKTAVPSTLRKYGFDLDYILNDSHFSLKEKKLPNLCADRIDYLLRAAIFFDEINLCEASALLADLTVQNGDWIFKTFVAAEKFAAVFKMMNDRYYANVTAAIMFQSVGDYLKHALTRKYITEDDLYTDDETVLNKIKPFLTSDKKLDLFWRRMNKKTNIINDPADFDVSIFCKSRVVDPLFNDDGKIKRLSDKIPEWKNVIQEESKPKQYFLKFKD